MKQSGNIMIVGVGGQGTLLASRILGNLLVSQGLDVKVSEVHGMSQRGGSVVTYVKYGPKVYSPIIEKGEADVLLAFEKCEAARGVPYLKKDGHIIVNEQEIDPMPVITGACQYPQGIVEHLKALGCRVTPIDALSLAEKAGSAKAVNVVLIGYLSRLMEFPLDVWQKILEETVPPKFLDMNRKAFALGREVTVL